MLQKWISAAAAHEPASNIRSLLLEGDAVTESRPMSPSSQPQGNCAMPMRARTGRCMRTPQPLVGPNSPLYSTRGPEALMRFTKRSIPVRGTTTVSSARRKSRAIASWCRPNCAGVTMGLPARANCQAARPASPGRRSGHIADALVSDRRRPASKSV